MRRCRIRAAILAVFGISSIVAQEIRLARTEVANKPIGSVRVIFDQNDKAFYEDSTERLTQFPRVPAGDLPYDKFAVYVGLGNGSTFIDALESKPQNFNNLKTGYYVVPPSGSSLNTFGLVMNADDPRNGHSDITYVMPAIWLRNSSVTGPLRPWADDFDSLEYSVDMRVPFARSQNVYHPNLINDKVDSGSRSDFAAPYILGGIYLRQIRALKNNAKAPALWIAVSFFDLRKHYTLETITIDTWSGGTNYPIVMTTIGNSVSPDEAKPFPEAPPKKPMTKRAPAYQFTLPGSESLMTESHPGDLSFHHFAFRITAGNLFSAIYKIRERMPQLYGENGLAPMSTNPEDWALEHFNFDAEIFHRSTLPKTVNAKHSRAMVVEFRNLRVQQAVRNEPIKGFFQDLAPDKDGHIEARGWACVPGSEQKLRIQLTIVSSDGQIAGLRQAIADHASEKGIQDACQITTYGEEARADGRGFRFSIPLSKEALNKISDVRVSAASGGSSTPIPKVPGWSMPVPPK
jgi:hypothetical protein